MSRFKVNIQLLPVKAHYFFFSAGSSAIWPFIPVLGKQLGISSTEVGAIYGAAPFLGFLVKPSVGILADHFKKRKSIFLFSILLGLMATVCIGFLGQEGTRRPVVFNCGFGSSYVKQCSQSVAQQNCPSHSNNVKNGSSHNLYSYSDSEESGYFATPSQIQDTKNYNNETEPSTSQAPSLGQNKATNGAAQSQQLISDEQFETCRLTCFIHSIPDFLEFCDSLDKAYMPEDCKRRVRDDEHPSPSVLPTNSPDTASMKTINPKETHKEIEPYTLDFDVKVSNSFIDAGDCLFLQVHEISFKPGVDNFHKFTCLSNQNDLDSCFIDCVSNELNLKMERVMPLEDDEQFSSTKFWLFGLLVVIAFVSMAVVNSISDALCFQLLGDRPDLYGHQRLWGAVGWGLFTFFAGFLIDSTSRGKLLKDYSPCFYLMTALLVLDLIVAYKWEIKEMPRPKALAKDVCVLISDMRIIIFFFASLIIGMCTGIHWHFLFWFVEDVSNENCDSNDNIKSLQGVMVAVQCLSEMPFFYYARSFIKKLGYVNCMTLVLFVFGIRLLIYSVLYHAWLFIPVELFHGITFGVFYAVLATYASEISPPGSTATVQGIFGAAFEGIGVALGSLIGGIFFRMWDGRIAFRIFGFGSLIFCVIHHILMLIFNRKSAYGIPISTSEPDGREMCNMNGVAHDVDVESDN